MKSSWNLAAFIVLGLGVLALRPTEFALLLSPIGWDAGENGFNSQPRRLAPFQDRFGQFGRQESHPHDLADIARILLVLLGDLIRRDWCLAGVAPEPDMRASQGFDQSRITLWSCRALRIILLNDQARLGADCLQPRIPVQFYLFVVNLIGRQIKQAQDGLALDADRDESAASDNLGCQGLKDGKEFIPCGNINFRATLAAASVQCAIPGIGRGSTRFPATSLNRVFLSPSSSLKKVASSFRTIVSRSLAAIRTGRLSVASSVWAGPET